LKRFGHGLAFLFQFLLQFKGNTGVRSRHVMLTGRLNVAKRSGDDGELAVCFCTWFRCYTLIRNEVRLGLTEGFTGVFVDLRHRASVLAKSSFGPVPSGTARISWQRILSIAKRVARPCPNPGWWQSGADSEELFGVVSDCKFKERY
jgi:hypothetical protein